MLSRPQTLLVAHALALIAILFFLVPYLTSTYGKIGADNRAAASAFAVRHGLA